MLIIIKIVCLMIDFRLLRVRQRHEFDTKRSVGEIRSGTVNLYDDYGFLHEKALYLGSVQRIILAGQFGNKDYKEPVTYDHLNKEKLTIMLSIYESTDNSGSQLGYVASGKTITTKFTNIISHVNLTFENSDQKYLLNADEFSVLEVTTKRLLKPKAQKENSKPKSVRVRATETHKQYEADDGRDTIVVQPVKNETSLRRSSRSRRVKTSLSDFII